MEKKILGKNKEYNDPVDILVVEDNPIDSELIIRSISKLIPACQIYLAEDGEEALDFVFSRRKFSHRNSGKSLRVIFLDIKLPKVNGFEFLKVVKTNPHMKSIPVVMISSSGENADIEEAFNLGANSYIVKPMDFDQFTIIIQKTATYWLSINEFTNNKIT